MPTYTLKKLEDIVHTEEINLEGNNRNIITGIEEYNMLEQLYRWHTNSAESTFDNYYRLYRTELLAHALNAAIPLGEYIRRNLVLTFCRRCHSSYSIYVRFAIFKCYGRIDDVEIGYFYVSSENLKLINGE